jgi:hypothetical protein
MDAAAASNNTQKTVQQQRTILCIPKSEREMQTAHSTQEK